jgi:hypothetical protein
VLERLQNFPRLNHGLPLPFLFNRQMKCAQLFQICSKLLEHSYLLPWLFEIFDGCSLVCIHHNKSERSSCFRVNSSVHFNKWHMQSAEWVSAVVSDFLF